MIKKGKRAGRRGERVRENGPLLCPRSGCHQHCWSHQGGKGGSRGEEKAAGRCVWGGASVLPKIHRWAVSIPHGEPGPEPNTSCPQAQTLGGSSDVTGLLAPTWETWRASQGRERPRRGSLVLSADSCLELPQGDTVPEMAGASTAGSGQ